MALQLTPSQTVGPYFSIGLTWDDGAFVVPEGTPGAIRIRGRVFDGEGEPVPDAMIETWQADPEGRYNHPDDPRGRRGGRLPRVRPRPDRRRGALRHPHRQARPGARPGWRDRRRRTSRCRSSPAACSTASSPGSTSPTRRDANAADPVLRSVPERAARDAARRSRSRGRLPLRRPPPGGGRDCLLRHLRTPCRPGSSTASSPAGRVPAEISARAWLQAMLDAEAALAARAGARRPDLRRRRRRDRRRVRRRRTTPAAIGAEAAKTGNPVVPLVKALTEAVAGPAGRPRPQRRDEPGHPRHRRDARRRARARAAARGPRGRRGGRGPARRRAPRDRHGRPHADAAGAADHVRAQGGRLARRTRRGRGAAGRGARATRLAAQLGGAAGTLASLDPAGPEVLGHFADELGLDEPVLAWHTIRTRPAELAGALGAAAGVVAKVARDVVLMAQTEVGEVREGVPGRGGSSTLPHKRNPVAAISAVARRHARARPRRHAARRDGARARARRRRRGTPSGGRCASCSRRSARPPRGCATASSTSRSTPSACARTSTSRTGRCSPSA